MILIMTKATYEAKNGRIFKFVYNEYKRIVEVYTDDKLHLTIVNVDPQDSTAQMNGFMDAWNQANPA